MQVKSVVFVHNNLRLADKLQQIDYCEPTIDWASNDQFDSESSGDEDC